MILATQNPEAGHLVIFVVIAGITLWTLVSGWWDAAAWLLLFNVLHNGYPVSFVPDWTVPEERPNKAMPPSIGAARTGVIERFRCAACG